MNRLRLAALTSFALMLPSLGSCGGGRVEPRPSQPPAQLVEIEVEVYDPVTNGVWENVGVRIVEAYNEWSDCTCPTTRPDEFLLTDSQGLVYFSPEDIAFYEVGFAEDVARRAVLSPRVFEDEATVLLEVYADGFPSVFVQVDLTWDQPYAFVSVPFE